MPTFKQLVFIINQLYRVIYHNPIKYQNPDLNYLPCCTWIGAGVVVRSNHSFHSVIGILFTQQTPVPSDWISQIGPLRLDQSD